MTPEELKSLQETKWNDAKVALAAVVECEAAIIKDGGHRFTELHTLIGDLIKQVERKGLHR